MGVGGSSHTNKLDRCFKCSCLACNKGFDLGVAIFLTMQVPVKIVRDGYRKIKYSTISVFSTTLDNKAIK